MKYNILIMELFTKNLGFHVSHEQTHVHMLFSLHFSCQQVDIMFSPNGVCNLINVTNIDLNWIGLVSQVAMFQTMVMYNTNGFKIKTMYDYYIAMKSMFLVVKLSSHSFIHYASLIILLPWITHKQHQNYSKLKAFQNQNFNSHKLCIHTITLYKWRCFSRSQTPF